MELRNIFIIKRLQNRANRKQRDFEDTYRRQNREKWLFFCKTLKNERRILSRDRGPGEVIYAQFLTRGLIHHRFKFD